MDYSNKKLLFFFLIFVFYFIFARGAQEMCDQNKMGRNCCYLVSGLIFTLSIFVLFSFCENSQEPYHSEYRGNYVGGFGSSSCGGKNCGCSGQDSKGRNLNLTLGKLCRGGPYMWQGDAKLAKACRELNSSDEGKDEISRYECGPGFSGMPGCGFKFTPDSDKCWNNARCKDLSAPCDESANGIF